MDFNIHITKIQEPDLTNMLIGLLYPLHNIYVIIYLCTFSIGNLFYARNKQKIFVFNDSYC